MFLKKWSENYEFSTKSWKNFVISRAIAVVDDLFTIIVLIALATIVCDYIIPYIQFST